MSLSTSIKSKSYDLPILGFQNLNIGGKKKRKKGGGGDDDDDNPITLMNVPDGPLSNMFSYLNATDATKLGQTGNAMHCNCNDDAERKSVKCKEHCDEIHERNETAQPDENGNNRIHRLVQQDDGNRGAVLRSLCRRFPGLINVQNDRGRTPLCIAAWKGKEGYLALLIEAGANVDIADNDTETPVFKATKAKNNGCLAQLIAAEANINIGNHMNDIPVHVAAHNGDAECLSQLIAAGADINRRGHDKETPIYIATIQRNTECLSLLIGAGAYVNIPNYWGETPVQVARKRGYATCLALLKRGSYT